MSGPAAGDVTVLLRAHAQGDAHAFERLVGLVYQDLRRVARSQRRRLRPGDTLDTTALVHEAYVKLVDQTPPQWNNRGHFLAVIATAMRQILIDHARGRLRLKRGGGIAPVALDNIDVAAHDEASHFVAIDDALRDLATTEPRLVKVVECRFFAGYSEAETAEALGLSLRTVQRDWLRARAALRDIVRPS